MKTGVGSVTQGLHPAEGLRPEAADSAAGSQSLEVLGALGHSQLPCFAQVPASSGRRGARPSGRIQRAAVAQVSAYTPDTIRDKIVNVSAQALNPKLGPFGARRLPGSVGRRTARDRVRGGMSS